MVTRREIMAMAAAAAAAAPLPARPALAQPAWPTRPLRLVVPFPPGGTADLLGRLAARELEAALGQPVVVENRAGAGGAIGSDLVAKAPPDGQALILSNIASQAIGPAVTRYPYDPVRDFTHLGLVAAVPSALAVAADSPFRTLEELLARARQNPGSLRIGSPGNGTSGQAKLEILKRAAGVDITHVPYRGSAPAVTDVIAGNIEGVVAAVPDIGRNERLRLLVVTLPDRAARWPDVPSARELGIAPMVATNWFGLSAAAGTPGAIADRINAALVAALNRPEMVERLAELGAPPNRMTRQDYAALVESEAARWAELVRSAGIRAD